MADRNTVQKDIIHRTLCEMGGHPSAAAVYERVNLGHILRLELGGSDSRYDGETSPHSHVRCRLCGAVEDIPAVQVEPPSDGRGFLLEDCAVVYRGLCPACRSKAGV